MRASMWSLVLLSSFWMSAPRAQAHRPSDAYLVLDPETQDTYAGYWEIALRDLDQVYALDDGDGALRWGELRAREQTVLAALSQTLTFQRGRQACNSELQALSVVEHSDGNYAHIPLRLSCAHAGEALHGNYHFMAGIDASHRALLRSARADAPSQVLRAGQPFELMAKAAEPHATAYADVVRGMEHILGGLDHVLFLIVLLLPAVLRRRGAGLVPVMKLRPVLRDVVQVVTSFTLAHSLTLSLSALGIARAASSVIEPAIAASVLFAAANNVFPLVPAERWAPAFALGLLHGFGLSSALVDAGLSDGALLRSLFAFNVGVELGQLAVVALFVPLAFLLRKRAAYQRYGLRLGSWAVGALALFWLVDRIQGS